MLMAAFIDQAYLLTKIRMMSFSTQMKKKANLSNRIARIFSAHNTRDR